MLQNIYNIQVWCLAHKSEDHSVRVQYVEVYMWQQQSTHFLLGTKWILPDFEPADTGGHSGIHLEWVKKTACIESFVCVRWLTLDRLGAPIRLA